MKPLNFIFISVIAFLMACINEENKQEVNERQFSNVYFDTTVVENAKSRLPKSKTEIINIEHIPDTTGQNIEEWMIIDTIPDFPIDTVSLEYFWSNFQNNIRNNNKDKVIEILDFPIHAIFFVTFKFSYDCDTVEFSKDEDTYSDFDIDSSNIMEYYDFMFCKTLKKIILQTSTKDLLKYGIRYKKAPGLTYMFFSKNYLKVECPNNHNLKFFIRQNSEGWRIGIGGL